MLWKRLLVCQKRDILVRAIDKKIQYIIPLQECIKTHTLHTVLIKDNDLIVTFYIQPTRKDELR